MVLFGPVQWQASSSTSIVGGISLPSIIDSLLEIVGVAPAQTTCSPVTGQTLARYLPPFTLPCLADKKKLG